jgi:hypothetical protein
VSADSIVPGAGKPQSLNRYSYVNNSPLNYIDPTGHFTQEAIENYLKDTYQDDWDKYLKWWKDDTAWWNMLREAKHGDLLLGSSNFGGTASEAIYQFWGHTNPDGTDFMGGLVPFRKPPCPTRTCGAATTLGEIQAGISKDAKYVLGWYGLIRQSTGQPEILLRSDSYTSWTKSTPHGGWQSGARFMAGAAEAGAVGLIGGYLGNTIAGAGFFAGDVAAQAAGFSFTGVAVDALDIAPGDVQVHIQSKDIKIYLNFNQADERYGWVLESYRLTFPH